MMSCMRFPVLCLAVVAALLASASLAQEGAVDPLREKVDKAIRESEERIGRMAPGVDEPSKDPASRLFERMRPESDDAEEKTGEGDAADAEGSAPFPFPPVPEVEDPLEPFALDEEAMARYGIVRDETATERFGSPVFKPYSYGQRPVPRDRFEQRVDQLFSGSDPGFNTLQDPAARTREQDRAKTRYQGYVEPNTGFITPPNWPSGDTP